MHQGDTWGSGGRAVLGEVVFVCLVTSPLLLHIARQKLTG